MKLTEYKVKWCPVCDQGWIEIVKIISTGELVLCCSECECEWKNPDNIANNTAQPYSMEAIENPGWEDILKKSWTKYILK